MNSANIVGEEEKMTWLLAFGKVPHIGETR